MPNYRRQFDPGGMFFFTLVTAGRRSLFSDETARRHLRAALRTEQAEHPFDLLAIALLPEHVHCIWKLPEGDSDFSLRWSRIKRRFTQQWIAAGGGEAAISKTRRDRRERGVWQKRFWEHRIRDEEDMMRHVNYIHYNPVKHGLGVLNRVLVMISEKRPLLFFGLAGGIAITLGIVAGILVLRALFTVNELAVGTALVSMLLITVGMLCIFAGVILNVLVKRIRDSL